MRWDNLIFRCWRVTVNLKTSIWANHIRTVSTHFKNLSVAKKKMCWTPQTETWNTFFTILQQSKFKTRWPKRTSNFYTVTTFHASRSTRMAFARSKYDSRFDAFNCEEQVPVEISISRSMSNWSSFGFDFFRDWKTRSFNFEQQ